MSLTLNYNITQSEANQTLLNFLKKQDISKKTIVAVKHRGGNLLVNGFFQKVHYLLKEGDAVTLIFPQELRSKGLSPYKLKLNIVYEDEYLLVINKPAGIPTMPSIRYPQETLANGIIHYYNEQGLESTVHFINRLDRDTSGLLMVAKYRHIHHLLTRDMKQIKRKYYALVKGEIEVLQGMINEPIAREKAGNVRRCVREDGQPAMTYYQVIEHWNEMTLIQCELKTGRTHQIRVHLSHLGYPLIGDTLYDQEALELEFGQFLHSFQLQFKHPINKRQYCFETDLPHEFTSFRNRK